MVRDRVPRDRIFDRVQDRLKDNIRDRNLPQPALPKVLDRLPKTRLEKALDLLDKGLKLKKFLDSLPVPAKTLERIPGTNFYKTPDVIDPTDCENYPNSPYCGKNPFSLKPFDAGVKMVLDYCNIGIQVDTVFGFVKLPTRQYVYRFSDCIYKPPQPPKYENDRRWDAPLAPRYPKAVYLVWKNKDFNYMDGGGGINAYKYFGPNVPDGVIYAKSNEANLGLGWHILDLEIELGNVKITPPNLEEQGNSCALVTFVIKLKVQGSYLYYSDLRTFDDIFYGTRTYHFCIDDTGSVEREFVSATGLPNSFFLNENWFWLYVFFSYESYVDYVQNAGQFQNDSYHWNWEYQGIENKLNQSVGRGSRGAALIANCDRDSAWFMSQIGIA